MIRSGFRLPSRPRGHAEWSKYSTDHGFASGPADREIDGVGPLIVLTGRLHRPRLSVDPRATTLAVRTHRTRCVYPLSSVFKELETAHLWQQRCRGVPGDRCRSERDVGGPSAEGFASERVPEVETDCGLASLRCLPRPGGAMN